MEHQLAPLPRRQQRPRPLHVHALGAPGVGVTGSEADHPRQVHHRVLPGQGAGHRPGVAHVPPAKDEARPGDVPQQPAPAGDQGIEHRHPVAGVEEGPGDDRPDVAGAAGDEHVGHVGR